MLYVLCVVLGMCCPTTHQSLFQLCYGSSQLRGLVPHRSPPYRAILTHQHFGSDKDQEAAPHYSPGREPAAASIALHQGELMLWIIHFTLSALLNRHRGYY